MKILHLLMASFILAIPQAGFSQRSLSESIRESAEIHIYKLNEKDIQNLYRKEKKDCYETILHTFITSYPRTGKTPSLPRGNYMLVQAVEDKLSYTEYTVDNLNFSFMQTPQLMLYLYDTLGYHIDHAIVKKGAKKIRYNAQTRTYNIPQAKDEDIIEINNNGVYHYIYIEDYQDKPKTFLGINRYSIENLWYKLKRKVSSVFNPDDRAFKKKYGGFIVFNKPKYKPEETVKFKAYITKRKGKPYKKALPVSLQNHTSQLDTTLTILKPYRPGMYEWQFKLSDSLELRLDQYYELVFDTPGKHTNNISDRFYYEEYELKRNKFSVSANKEQYVKGDTVKLSIKATDENEMPVYDGKITVTVSPGLSFNKKYYNHTGFIPDKLWEHTCDITQVNSQELILPDSIFVKDVTMNYHIDIVYLNADNEKQEQSLNFFRDARDRTFDLSVSKGFLSIKELENGISRKTPAIVTAYGENWEILSRSSVTLPVSLPIRWNVLEYYIETPHLSGCYFPETEDHILDYQFTRNNDTLKLSVDNPSEMPFWYTIKKNKRTIAQGYTTQLNYTLPHAGKAGYAMQLNYIIGEEHRTIRDEIPFGQKNISLNVLTPTRVYPGQTAQVSVSVADKKGKPVKYADITAYGVTSRFGNLYPNIPIYGKIKYAEKFKETFYDSDIYHIVNQKRKLEWDKWKERLGLDSIEYYKFLYPTSYYTHTQASPGNVTQISPYVVIDGEIQPVHILWIDEYPYYSIQSQQDNVYSFSISPGFHSLRMKTFDRETCINLWIEPGLKTIISVNGEQSAFTGKRASNDIPTTSIQVNKFDKKQLEGLKNMEFQVLSNYMLRVENNFSTYHLPGLTPLEIPAYIYSGGTCYYLNRESPAPRNWYGQNNASRLILAGPFPFRSSKHILKNMGSLYFDTAFISNFELKGGYDYLIQRNYLKLESWKEFPFNNRIASSSPPVKFDQYVLTPEEIHSRFNDKITSELERSVGAVSNSDENVFTPESKCKLEIIRPPVKHDRIRVLSPMLILLTHESNDTTTQTQLYYGLTNNFSGLPEGNVRLTFVFRDTTQYTYTLHLQEGGTNYLYADTITTPDPDSLSRLAFRMLQEKVQITHAPDKLTEYSLYSKQDSILTLSPETTGTYNSSNAQKDIVTGIVLDKKGEPLPGTNVSIKNTPFATVTDINGRFTLKGTASGDILFAFIGFQPVKTKFIPGYDYKITLEEDVCCLEEAVVVRGLGNRKETLTSSVQTLETSSKVYIRGYNSLSTGAKPLYIINGVVYDGNPSALDLSSFSSVTVLKDAEATALYGARAANGVIIIESNKNMTPRILPQQSVDTEEPAFNTLRRNFHDDAFWHPGLKTDKNGKLTFEVTYPDDITSWNAMFIAIGKRKQTDIQQITIHSFKPLTAQISVPQFSIRNDSLNVIGKITNYTGDTVEVKQNITVGTDTREKQITLNTSRVDTIPMLASEGDSLKVTYTLSRENGYFDGEERRIPIFEQGILETHGEFKVINDSLTHTFHFDPSLGEITLHTEASGLEMFLREIDNVDRYPYLCNEQMASKIKALLSKKRIYTLFDMKFKDDRKIEQLIRKLQQNQNDEYLWGWWNKSNSVYWISMQVIESLLEAEKEGYPIDINKQQLIPTFLLNIDRTLARVSSQTLTSATSTLKEKLLDKLVLLKMLGAQLDYEVQYSRINQLPNPDMHTRLKSMETVLSIGTKQKINIDTLLRYSLTTMMGSRYWEEPSLTENNGHPCISPHADKVELTLTAYRILKHIGGHEKELEQIRNYFFELHKGGSWRNTYESSRIMETIIPDLSREGEQFSDVKLNINGKTISTFPYTDKVEGDRVITIRKTGTLPVFFTAYQQAWNREPEAESKGFSVQSVFKENQNVVSILQAGKVTTLEIIVTADSDAEYVMIEVPIPAGCSYESKTGNNPWQESHREYFKEKVSIFCDRLPKGEHRFTIKLIPRYTGRYHLNPARAELMYFPTFYGRENLKVTEIK